jgi:hypothetical protein
MSGPLRKRGESCHGWVSRTRHVSPVAALWWMVVLGGQSGMAPGEGVGSADLSIAHYDRATAAFVPAPDTEVDALRRSLGVWLTLAPSAKPLVEEPGVTEAGGVRVRLDESFASASQVVLSGRGEVVVTCSAAAASASSSADGLPGPVGHD